MKCTYKPSTIYIKEKKQNWFYFILYNCSNKHKKNNLLIASLLAYK